MANNTTSLLSNSIRTQYLSNYIEGALMSRLYDQLASPVAADMSNIAKGSSVTIPFLSSFAPSSQTISEVTDIATVSLRDATATLTPTSRANSVVVSEKLLNTAYTDFAAKWYERLGQNMMESVDQVAMAAAVAAPLNFSSAARASLDAGTAADKLSKSTFSKMSTNMAALHIPSWETPAGKRWIALMHPYAYADLMADTTIVAVGQYQDSRILFNWEMGELHNFSLVVSPYAKVFWGAGADNGSVVATTISSAVNALDKVFSVASASNIAVGDRLTLGTEETSTTLYPTNEIVIVTAIDTLAISFVGQGENGGLKYDHASGEAVRNADSVASVIFGGPESMAKVYDTAVGEYGQMIAPYKDGSVEQFTKAGWKWYGGYGIISDNRVARVEVALGIDA